MTFIFRFVYHSTNCNVNVNVISLPTEYQGVQRTRSEISVHSRIELEFRNFLNWNLEVSWSSSFVSLCISMMDFIDYLACFSSICKTPSLFWPFFKAASKLTQRCANTIFWDGLRRHFPQNWFQKIRNVDLYPLILIVFLWFCFIVIILKNSE